MTKKITPKVWKVVYPNNHSVLMNYDPLEALRESKRNFDELYEESVLEKERLEKEIEELKKEKSK